MTSSRPSFVVFCAAAGPRLGFGHLMRCSVLGRALGSPRALVVRGGALAAARARALGWTLRRDAVVESSVVPDLMVIDDPSSAAARRWVGVARREGVPAATVHDLGLARVDSDLSIDGSITTMSGSTRATLSGPRFAILDPAVLECRRRPPARQPGRVLIALGGGMHVRRIGARLAGAILAAAPQVTVEIAAGFAAGRLPALPRGARWIRRPDGLVRDLASASVAVTAGGVTIYEACAVGAPVVALAVTPVQRRTTRALAAAGAVLDASAGDEARSIRRAAALVVSLVRRDDRSRALGRRARTIVDGRGAIRVVERLSALVHQRSAGGRRHAA